MPTVKIREGETFEGAMRRFKRGVDKTKKLQKLREKEYYVSGSVMKQRQKAAAKKRLAKKLARDKANFKEVAKFGGHNPERSKEKKVYNQAARKF